MNCQGLGLFNKFLAGEISQYLSYKKAKTVAEKQHHSSIFIQSNERRMEKEFCQQCPFKPNCEVKNGKEGEKVKSRLSFQKELCQS